MRTLRTTVYEARGVNTAVRVANNFVTNMDRMGVPGPGSVVAGYWAVGSELDMLPLLFHLHNQGYVCALPVVAAKDHPLVFRHWNPGMTLKSGILGTKHPGGEVPEVVPDTLIVPLFAFDREGFRLGHGGGYYDRTLQKLRADGEILAIGVAFALQQVDRVPRDQYDQPLDWVVTEEGIVKIGE